MCLTGVFASLHLSIDLKLGKESGCGRAVSSVRHLLFFIVLKLQKSLKSCSFQKLYVHIIFTQKRDQNSLKFHTCRQLARHFLHFVWLLHLYSQMEKIFHVYNQIMVSQYVLRELIIYVENLILPFPNTKLLNQVAFSSFVNIRQKADRKLSQQLVERV